MCSSSCDIVDTREQIILFYRVPKISILLYNHLCIPWRRIPVVNTYTQCTQFVTIVGDYTFDIIDTIMTPFD